MNKKLSINYLFGRYFTFCCRSCNNNIHINPKKAKSHAKTAENCFKVNLWTVFLPVLFLISLVAPLAAVAEDVSKTMEPLPEVPFIEVYNSKKLAIIADFNRCDLIKAQEIIDVSTLPLSELSTKTGLKKLFKATVDERNKCYKSAKASLQDLLKLALAEAEVEDEFSAKLRLRAKLDDGLNSIMTYRSDVSAQLLMSNLEDIELALLTYVPSVDACANPAEKEGDKQVDECAPVEVEDVFVEESARTKNLLNIEASLINEIDRRELFLEQLQLSQSHSVFSLMPLKVQIAHHYFVKALSEFDYLDLNSDKGIALMQINADIDYGYSQLRQALSMARNVDMKNINQQIFKDLLRLDRKIRMITLSMGSIPEEGNALFGETYNSWVHELYLKISELASETNVMQSQLVALNRDYNEAKQKDQANKAKMAISKVEEDSK